MADRPAHTCPQCAAAYTAPDDSCHVRWQQLLALDHSRQAPWGPLHALTFATWMLQHPDTAVPGTKARCRELLERVIGRGEPLERVVSDFRRRLPGDEPRHSVDLPTPPRRFEVTIADLGDFGAATFESNLHRWALATLASWFAAAAAHTPGSSA